MKKLTCADYSSFPGKPSCCRFCHDALEKRERVHMNNAKAPDGMEANVCCCVSLWSYSVVDALIDTLRSEDEGTFRVTATPY